MIFEPFINPDRHVLWVDVPDFEDKQQPGSTSRTNKAEAEAVALVIKALKKAEGFDDYMSQQVAKEDKEIGIITFYGAQAALLEEMKKTGKLDSSLSYRINVVDKFQGMERNIIIISTAIISHHAKIKNNADYAKVVSAIGNNKIDIQTLKHLVKNGKE